MNRENMRKILIIDDDKDMVESMRVVLESAGYVVATAKTGEEGLQETRAQAPDLIILDVMMENGDKGFEVARILKKDAAYQHIPIIMLTAIKEALGLDFRHEAGDRVWLPVDDYCEKPLHPDELLAKVKGFLPDTVK